LLRAIADQNNGEVITLLKEMSTEQVNGIIQEKLGWYFYKKNDGRDRNYANRYSDDPDYAYALSPLHVACLVDNRTAVAALLGVDGINVNQNIRKLRSAGWLSLQRLDLEESNCTDWSFEGGSPAGRIYSFPYEGYTPIMIAAAQKRTEIFNILVKDDRIDLKATVQSISQFWKVNKDERKMIEKQYHILLELAKRESVEKTVKPTKTPQQVALVDLSSSFGDLLKSGEMSDFKIVCGGEEILCHKNILVTRSNVLRNMMANDMRESQENCMKITDLDLNIVQIFVKFIYTGEVASDDLQMYTEELFEVANRYELNGLIKLCEHELILRINNSNVLAIVTKAHMYHADKLREACMKWIVNHRKNIVKPEGWRENLKRFPELLMDIMEAFTS